MAIGQIVLPETYEEFMRTHDPISAAQDWKTVVKRLDDILGFQVYQNDQVIQLLHKIVPGVLTYPEMQAAQGIPLYTVRKYSLATARTDEELQISGDLLAAWTDGTLIGCSVNIDSATADDIPLDKFNPITYPTGWEKIYLTTAAQTGKTLFLFFGRAAGAATHPETTTSAGREALYIVRSDKDDNFTGALGQYAKEDENLTGMITNKARITGLTLLSDQQLKFKVLFWSKDTFDDNNLDLDTFLGEVDVDLTVYGWQVNGIGPWRMSIENLAIGYRDDDSTNELHISVMNMSGTGKKVFVSGLGDVDDDGEITSADATMIANYVVGNITLTADQLLRADVTGDGAVTGADAMAIEQYVAGTRGNFPASAGVVVELTYSPRT